MTFSALSNATAPAREADDTSRCGREGVAVKTHEREGELAGQNNEHQAKPGAEYHQNGEKGETKKY